MTELSFNKAIISSKVVFQEVGGEAVLLDLAGGHYYRLDEVATRIWQLLEQQGDLHSIIQTLGSEFDVDEAVLRQDLNRFIIDLTRTGLIVLQ